MAVAAKNDSPTPSTTSLPASFSRLKAQRVKALAKRKSLKHECVSKPADMEVRDSIGKKKVLNSLKYPSISQESQEMTGEDLDNSYVPLSLDEDKYEPIRQERQVSVPTASGLRGWGKGGSTHNHKPQSTELLKHRNKSSTDTNFFSRKSFKELGCDDYMIESLKRQSILRPSQIQVCLW